MAFSFKIHSNFWHSQRNDKVKARSRCSDIPQAQAFDYITLIMLWKFHTLRSKSCVCLYESFLYGAIQKHSTAVVALNFLIEPAKRNFCTLLNAPLILSLGESLCVKFSQVLLVKMMPLCRGWRWMINGDASTYICFQQQLLKRQKTAQIVINHLRKSFQRIRQLIRRRGAFAVC